MLEAGDGVTTLRLSNIGAFNVKDDGDVGGDSSDGAFEEGEAFAAEAFKVGAIGLEGSCKGGSFFNELAQVIFDFGKAVVMVFDTWVESDAEVTDSSAAGAKFLKKGHDWVGARILD